MQLVKDGKIILDLDEAVETNHTTTWCKHCRLAPSLIKELVIIQFGSLEPVVLPVMVSTTFMEAKPVPDILNEDDEGWTLVTRRRPKKQRPIQPPPLCRRKRQGRKKNPRCPRGKKMPNSDRKHEVHPIDLLEEEPLLPVTVEEFFLKDLFRQVAVNMVSCSELKDEDGEEDVQIDVQEAPSSSTYDKVLAVLEVLPERMSWKQIFHLPEEMHEQVVVALHHAKLYVDKVKAVKEPTKLPTQCATCNMVMSFTDEDLLLGSKPNNRPLFVTSNIRGKKSSLGRWWLCHQHHA